jgi:hypothetical protein
LNSGIVAPDNIIRIGVLVMDPRERVSSLRDLIEGLLTEDESKKRL